MISATTACKPTGKEGNADGKPVVTVTIEPLRYLTEAIAGNRYHVVSMVPKGSNPEPYDPTPQQLMGLSKSKAYLRIGYIGFEVNWMDKLTDNAPHVPVFDMSQGINLIYESAHAQGNANKHPEEVEPHIWNSAHNAQIIAKNILHAFLVLDKQHETEYVHRYDSLSRCLARTDSLIRARLSAPDADRSFLIYHPALSYFARDYGLHQIPIEENGKEPSPVYLRDLIKSCRSEKIRIIFIQPEFDRRNAEIIARQTGTTVVSIQPLAYDWQAEMRFITHQLIHH
jgi:zinc transport system substrate-binding protein